MRTLLLMVPLIMVLCCKAEACVELISQDVEFINEDSKTTGIVFNGVLQNQCGRAVEGVSVILNIADDLGYVRHVYKKFAAYRLVNSERAEFYFKEPVKYNIAETHIEFIYQ